MKYISVRKLLSDSFQLAFAGCQAVREFHERREHYTHYTKSNKDDLVTEADYKVQTMIMRGLRMNFPDLRVVGEENQEFKGELGFDIQKLNQEVFPRSVHFQQKLLLSETCAWIDPIDSTRSMVEGQLQNVTVLIGFSNNKQANCGVIGIPYFKQGDQLVYRPSIIVGSLGDRRSYEYSEGKWRQITNLYKQLPTDLHMTISSSPKGHLEKIFKNKFERPNKWVGGAGRRISMIIRGQSSLTVYCPGWTCKWDTCAGEAIIKSIGGYFTNRQGNNIVYDPDLDVIKNKNGIICTLDHEMYDQAIQAYQEYNVDK